MYSHQPSLQFTSWSSEVDKFIALLLASGIACYSAIQAACMDFDTKRTDENAIGDLAKHLISKRVLTDWQCNNLIQGKYKGFFIDYYCMLAQIGKGETTSTYLARDSRSGELVALVVTPPMIKPWVDGRPHYYARELTTEEQQAACT